MKRAIAFVALALLAAMLPARAGGSFTKHTYGAPGAQGTRDYWVYSPGPSDHKRPLIVFLHGCIQDAPGAATSTRFNALADARDFIVAYPQQNVTGNQSAPLVDGNGIGCWNWFLPDDQVRDAGEPATIAGLTREVIASENIDPDRVYVEGISAGADMAVIMAANYPDLYAAAGAVAGCAFRTCADATGALTKDAMGPRARVVPLFVEQGTADTLNVFPLSQGLVGSWLGADDLADDGAMNGSISRAPAAVEHHGLDQTPQPGSGDICVRNQNWPCPGGAIGFTDSYPYSVEHYADAKGCGVLDFWIIHGMEHTYPKSPPTTVFSDPLGPDITTPAYEFFMAHPRTACPS